MDMREYNNAFARGSIKNEVNVSPKSLVEDNVTDHNITCHVFNMCHIGW